MGCKAHIIRLFSLLIGYCTAQDSYLRYYPPFIRQDFSHYAKEVECYTGIGENYAGNQNYSNSGKPCVDWKQTKFRGQASCVYCRNPSSDSTGPWCYVDSLGTRESCHLQIPECGTVYRFDNGSRVSLTHNFSKRNETRITVTFKPTILPNSSKVIKYSVFSVPGDQRTGIHLLYTWKPDDGSSLQLQWKFHEDISPIEIESEKTSSQYFNVKIVRKFKNLALNVNNKVYKSVGKLETSFEDKGKILVGYDDRDPQSIFDGCMSNLNYNGLALVLEELDEAQNRKYRIEKQGEVTKTETCMFVAPPHYTQPPYSSATPLKHLTIAALLLRLAFSER